MSDEDVVTLPNEVFEPIRGRVTIEVGALVQMGNAIYRLAQVLDFESVIGNEVETGRSVPLRIGDIRPVARGCVRSGSSNLDLAEIADEDWRIAEQRFAAIKPLIERHMVSRKEATHRAKEIGVDPSTLYRWLQRYKAYGEVSTLIPRKPGWKDGKSRIPPDADEVIGQVIREFYLSPQRPTVLSQIFGRGEQTPLCSSFYAARA